MTNKTARVVVGMSGGVDSSVAAYLLKEQGYDVIGIFMKNWHDETVTISNECPWLEDSYDAMIVAKKLMIPFQVIDFSKEYKKRIVDYMFSEYKVGRTPNPDILCNKEIKFDLFLKKALEFNADYIATGHYASVRKKGNVFELISGLDKKKDQSYFLCQLNQNQLSKIIFPLGNLNKDAVREIAKKNNLVTADKKDSQGLCFVGKVSLPDFLQQKLKKKKGNVIEIPGNSKLYDNQIKFIDENERLLSLTDEIDYTLSDGKIIGKHNGAYYYTIGQRKGLAIGGYKDPLFVISTNTQTNEIFVGEGKNHPGLIKKALKVKFSNVNWVNDYYNFENLGDLKLKARIRYRQKLQKISVYKHLDYLYVEFEDFQSAVTKGQFLAIYDNSQLIASGVIC